MPFAFPQNGLFQTPPLGQGSFFGGGGFDIPSSFWQQPTQGPPQMTGTPEGGLSLQALQALGMGGGLLANDFPGFNQYALGTPASSPEVPQAASPAAPQAGPPTQYTYFDDQGNSWVLPVGQPSPFG